MRKCKNCQVAILDNTLVCPLCSSVLEGEAEALRAEAAEAALEDLEKN